jgi:hypothetical protein
MMPDTNRNSSQVWESILLSLFFINNNAVSIRVKRYELPKALYSAYEKSRKKRLD